MQLSVPNGPQPSQNPPLVQWNPCKYYSVEQRPGKPGELYKADNTPQVQTVPSRQLGSLQQAHQSVGHPVVRSGTTLWWNHSYFIFSLFLFLCSLYLGQYSAHQPPGLPHSVSHPFALWQREQHLSRSGTLTPHFSVSSAGRTHSRYNCRVWQPVNCCSHFAFYFTLYTHMSVMLNLCSYTEAHFLVFCILHIRAKH